MYCCSHTTITNSLCVLFRSFLISYVPFCCTLISGKFAEVRYRNVFGCDGLHADMPATEGSGKTEGRRHYLLQVVRIAGPLHRRLLQHTREDRYHG